MPDTLEIRIPKMPMWEQIGGDMDPGAHGGILAKSDGDALEMLEIQPVRAHVGDKEAADIGFPFWTRTAYYDLSDLDPSKKEVQSALNSSGFDSGDQKTWLEEEATPEQRALAIAESLLSYGVGVDEGDSGWSDDVIHEDVKWWGDKVAGSEYIADEDEEFKNDVLGYDEIRKNLEEMVEQMADQSAATSRSTLGDQDVDDAERDGYDPRSLVCVAVFGDAVGVNGDLEPEKTEAGVEADLEKDGYEMLDNGGRIPDTEEHVSPGHAIRAVAKEMDIDEDVVKEAAQGLDWWPKDRYDEIASSTSGTAYTWGKKNKHAHVEDGDYVIQGSWSDGRVSDSFGMNDEEAAVSAAKKLLRDPTFEGDEVTVITRDGELVWSSNPDEGNHTEERRRHPAYGNKRDYPKIDIFVDGNYVATTTWARTNKEAVEQYIAKNPGADARKVTAARQEPARRRH